MGIFLKGHRRPSGEEVEVEHGGGSLLQPPLLTQLKVPLGGQSIPDSTNTAVIFTLDGDDPIGITRSDGTPLGVGFTDLRLPIGWYAIFASFYWELDNTGSRYAQINAGNVPGVDVIVPGAAYPVLDNLDGLCIPPFVTFVEDDTPPVLNLTAAVFQDSGGPLVLSQGFSVQVQKLS